MTNIVTPRGIEVPAITARVGELLDVATIQEGISWLDPRGLTESYNCITTDSVAQWPCPPIFQGPPVQTASSTVTTGGTIPAGTYRFVVTALNSRGETLKSNEVSQVTTGAASRITVNWNAVPGAVGYRIYGTNGASGSQANYYEASGAATSITISAWPGAGVQSGTPPTSSSAVISVTKTPSAPGWMDGIQFAVYSMPVCKGFDDSDHAKSEATAAFLANESVGVERALLQQRFAGGGTFPVTIDLTPATGTLSPAEGLALLENYMAGHYAGVPTIHVSRGVGSLLFTQQAIERNGSKFQSKQGSKVASGGGYGNPNSGPGGVAAAAGTSWMYATGEVVLARGEIVAQSSVNQTTNEHVTLIERGYIAAVDCMVVAVKVGDDINLAVLEQQNVGPDLVTGVDEVSNSTWTPPAGELRSVTVIVTSGLIEVDGDQITAPHSVSFDADTGEVLSPPVIVSANPGSRALVTWVAVP